MRHCPLTSAVVAALGISIFSAQARADQLNTWVGGIAPCPTCWSQSSNWSLSAVPNSTANPVSVTINAGGSQPILDTIAGGFIIDNLTLQTGASLGVNNGQALGIDTSQTGGTATFLNNGAFSLNSSGSGTSLNLYGANGIVNLNGTGTFTMGNSNTNQIIGEATGITFNNNSTIRGAGSINAGGTGFTFNNNAGGVINANQATSLFLGNTVNTGLLEATNGGTLTLQGTVANAGGTVSAGGAGSTVLLNGATISGGTLQGAGGGQFTQSGSYSTLRGTVALNGVLNVSNASGLNLDASGGALTLNIGGGLNLNATGNSSDLALAGTNGTINLNGPVTLSASVNNRIYANSAGMTLNNNSTIQGAGQIGIIGNSFSFNNNASGIVNANQTTVPLILNVSTTNAGLLEATNGGTLSLGGVTIGNTAGTISSIGAGSIVALNGTTVNGGTLSSTTGGQFTSTGSSTLSGTVALNGLLSIANASGLTLNATAGPLTLNFGPGGALNLNSTGNTADLILAGPGGTVNLNGPVTLSNNANNRIYANNTGMTLNSSGTIQGSGQIGVVGIPFTFNNSGTVNANSGAGLTLQGNIANTGLLEATNGGTLTLASGTLNNSNKTISATGVNSSLVFNSQNINNFGGIISTGGGAGSVTLNNTTVTSGTLLSNGGGTFQITGTSGFAGAIALNGALNVANASQLQLNTNGGTQAVNAGTGGAVNLNSTGNVTDLVLAGQGGLVFLNAPLTLSNNANNRIYANNTGMTLLNNGIIQGAGQIGVAGQTFTFNNQAAGIVNSNVGTLSLGAPVTNAGLLEATNGGTLSLGGPAITNTNGTISAIGAGSAVILNSTTIHGGTLQASGGGAFNSTGSSVLTGTIALNGQLNIGNATTLALDTTGGPVTINIGAGGGINLNSTANNTDLIVSGNNGTVNLNGPVTLSNNANNRIYAASTGMTLNSSSTIQGSGLIGSVGQALTFNNNGAVNANQSGGFTIGGTIVNTSGLLEATNGSTLTLQNGTVNNTGSTISANGANTTLNLINQTVTNTNGVISANGAGSSVNLNNAVINGGTLQASGGGQFFQTPSAAFSTLQGTIALNSVLNIGNASGLNLDASAGTMNLNVGAGGGLNLNSSGNITDLRLLGTNGTVNLNGPVTLSDNVNNRIYAGSTGMTLNNNSTIQGSGQIANVGQPLTFNNNSGGIINSNLAGGITLGGTVNNTGLIEATNGSGLTLTGVTFNNAGGIIAAIGNGSQAALNSSTIRGGTLQTTGGGQFTQTGGFSTLSGTVALNGVLNVNNASGLTLDTTSGPLTLNVGSGGGLNVNSTGNNTDLVLIGSNGTVNLNGPVTLSNNASNRIYANSTGMTLNNGGTIQGAGQIGAVSQNLTFNNLAGGLILASQSTPLIIGSVAAFSNAGTLQAASGSTLQISGSFANFNGVTLTGGTYNDAGTIIFNNADIVHNAATITMIGAAALIEDQSSLNGLRFFDDNLSGGSFTLEGGANFTASSAFSNAGFLGIFTNDLFSAGGAAYTQTGGTTQVDGTLTAGAVNIDGGDLKGTGTINGNVLVTTEGAVDPGDSPGTLSVSGNYTQSATGSLNLEIAGSGAGQFDVLNISGTANLSGTLNLATLTGFTAFNGESFKVLTFSSENGMFTAVTGLGLGNGFTFQVEYNTNDVTLLVTGTQAVAPEPGTWMLFAIGAAAIAAGKTLKRK